MLVGRKAQRLKGRFALITRYYDDALIWHVRHATPDEVQKVDNREVPSALISRASYDDYDEYIEIYAPRSLQRQIDALYSEYDGVIMEKEVL